MRKRTAMVLLVVLAGCQSDRYHLANDTAPPDVFDASTVPDAVPVFEHRTIAGNRSPYSVNGKTYQVLDTDEGYVETGVASWYGQKFHGYRTANGEVYNMYSMSAAHRSLPIPSYVSVTNLDNGRQVVVRVNDRGPFHSDRIIDLSYAAALKLGIVKNGTARVRLESVPMPAPGSVPYEAIPVSGERFYLQAGAFGSREGAEGFRQKLEKQYPYRSALKERILDGQRWFRVYLGPFEKRAEAEKVRFELRQANYPTPILLPEDKFRQGG